MKSGIEKKRTIERELKSSTFLHYASYEVVTNYENVLSFTSDIACTTSSFAMQFET